MSSKPLDVAIVGGGIVGVCLAIGLHKLSHLNVQLYESAPDFGEIGAGIALGPNALRAMRNIDSRLGRVCLNIATNNLWETHKETWFSTYIGEHPDPDADPKFVADITCGGGQTSFHRAKLLDEIISQIPKDIAQFNKRVDSYTELENGRLSLDFTDGNVAEADCVLGTDGIHSTIRKILLGKDHPTVAPKFTGAVAFRALVPMSDFRDVIGSEKAENSTMYHGRGQTIITYPIDNGKTVNVAATDHVNWRNWEGAWRQRVEFAKLKSCFSRMDATCQKIIKFFDQPNAQAWSMWESPPAPTYCKGNVAMLGDAAHASTPFQGQGCAQGIEDALVLIELFKTVTRRAQIPNALKAFDAIRRPLSQEQAASARETGLIHAMGDSDLPVDSSRFCESIMQRMHRWWDRDIGEEVAQAKAVFEHLDASRYDTTNFANSPRDSGTWFNATCRPDELSQKCEELKV